MKTIEPMLKSAAPRPAKVVREASDLAINGAPPAFSSSLHVGRPNIGDRERFLELVGEILDRRWLTNDGPLVQELERQLQAYLGVKHCVAICNGTIALEIAIRALELEGEVIVPSYTFIATAHALSWQGITPIFADIDPVTHLLDPEAVESMITPRTTGIIGVHLWGRPAPVEGLAEIAVRHDLKLMFDAAHALGCSRNGELVGRFGEVEVFSFHGTKFFNTFEGGAITTNNDELADKMRLIRNFGFAGYDNVIHLGTNGKMTEVCAAMGIANLGRIDEAISANRMNYEAYKASIDRIEGLRIMQVDASERFNYQYVIVEVGDECKVTRDHIVASLQAENVLARKYFWPGCHRMKPYRELYPHAGLMLPNTEKVADRVIVLPTGTAVDPTVCAEIANLMAVICTGDKPASQR
jgi:dTDP-4-amino-4,6-dideoxygalactose transaminase